MDFADISPTSTNAIANFTSNGDYVVVGQEGWIYKSSYASETGEHFAWARQRSDNKQYGFCFRNSAVFCQSTSYAMTIIGLKENYKVTITTSANAIASSFKGNNGGTWTESVSADNTTYTYTMSSDGDLNLMVAVGAYIHTVTVVEISGMESTKYTVKYQNASGTDLKDPVEYDTYVGETFTASASDMTTFYNGDSSKKYVYASGNTSKTAVSDASSNVITLVFNEYNKIAYTITAKNGEETLGSISSGNAYTDGSTTIYWNKFKDFDGQWYETSGSYGKTITEAGNTDVAFTPSAIAYFYEFETLSRSGGSSTVKETGTAYSNNTVGRIANSSGSYATLYTPALSAGSYTLYMPYYNGNNPGDADKIYVYVTNNISTLGDPVETFNILKTNTGNFTTNVTVPEGYYVAIQGAKLNSHNSQARIDYLTLTPRPFTGTIASSGYSSLACKYKLDFENATGLTAAYVVSNITKDAVTLTSVTELPANQGVILKGTSGAEYSIPVKATAAAPAINKLKAAVTATAIEANEAYILQGGKFCLVTADSEVPAGKAYLLAEDVPTNAHELGFVFEDDATGINNVENARQILSGDFYNLAGQRVAQPAKGLYIVNGRKVVVK